MRGLGRRMPVVFVCFLVGALSVIGLPPFGGLLVEIPADHRILRIGGMVHRRGDDPLVAAQPVLSRAGRHPRACCRRTSDGAAAPSSSGPGGAPGLTVAPP